MAKRVNHPLKSFALFLVVCGLGYVGYHYIHVKGVLRFEREKFVERAKLDEVRAAVMENFGTEEALLELGPVYYRPKENRYRIDLILKDGFEDRAKVLVREVAELIEERIGRDPEVWALNTGLHTVTRYLP